ncbi:MAG: hypothetical protein LBH98_07955 [Chitinispirillales bacterium]|jgi:hypothetical protein|nr:hypothetical protein [Chitinispirillales bacterium]
MLKKSIAAALTTLSFIAVSFAHLPPAHDASLRSRQTGFGARAVIGGGLRGETRADSYSNKGEWEAGGTYKGDFTIGKGDTVWHGDWKGKKLWWWAKFAPTSSDVPGETPPEGGTSAWVLINSLSAAANGTSNYQWSGWLGDLDGKGGNMWAVVPTWRDGAKGAYSMTHDDLGSDGGMPFDKSIQPGWDLAQDFPLIKQAWGAYVGAMDEEDWSQAKLMVEQGHEIFNHSMDHTSAADRWSVYNPGERLSSTDPDIPDVVQGLEVVGAWRISYHMAQGSWSLETDLEVFNKDGTKTITDRNGAWDGPLGKPNYEPGTWVDTLKASNDLVEIYAFPYWEGLSPNEEAPNGGIMKIVTKNGTEEVTISQTGQKMYVNKSLGKVAVNTVGWLDLPDIQSKYPFYYNGDLTKDDKGRPCFVLKVHSSFGWDAAGKTRNVVEANNLINDNLYGKVGATPYFVNGKRSEYFGYPFDVYSEDMHAYLENAGFVGARGGAKSGVPMPGDFFHPYRIDFDAFFIQDKDWTAESSGGDYVFPHNPHVLLGLNQLVEEVIAKKGYMVREFHAVADIRSDNGDWYNNSGNPDTWDVNDAGQDRGGWWGGIAEFQLRAHYEYLNRKITNREVVVYTPSEAVKYRMTANATAKNASLTKDGGNYKLNLTTTETIVEKYRDEISAIVALDAACNTLAAKYNDGEGTNVAPRRKPIKMDGEGKIWSVSVNPFRSEGEINLVPNGNWEGVEGGEEYIDWTSIKHQNGKTAVKPAAVSFVGIQNGQIALNLKAGNYTAELYNLQGRMVGKQNITAINGVNATGLRTDNLAKGMFILNVKQSGELLLNSKIMLK